MLFYFILIFRRADFPHFAFYPVFASQHNTGIICMTIWKPTWLSWIRPISSIIWDCWLLQHKKQDNWEQKNLLTLSITRRYILSVQTVLWCNNWLQCNVIFLVVYPLDGARRRFCYINSFLSLLRYSYYILSCALNRGSWQCEFATLTTFKFIILNSQYNSSGEPRSRWVSSWIHVWRIEINEGIKHKIGSITVWGFSVTINFHLFSLWTVWFCGLRLCLTQTLAQILVLGRLEEWTWF